MASLFKRQGKGYWIASWFDADGVRRSKSTRTTDKRTAERIAAKYEADVALVREGVLDPRALRIADEGRRPIGEHVEAFLADLAARGRSAKHLAAFRLHLEALIEEQKLSRLADLSGELVQRSMARAREIGRSSRTANARLQAARAFSRWCARTGRAPSNLLAGATPFDEKRDKRRERRALTAEEAQKLLAKAPTVERRAFYGLALLGGLRRGELERLEWRDVDLEAGQVSIRNGKGRALDHVPLRAELAVLLGELRAEAGAVLPTARVLPTPVSNDERKADFERAGIVLVDAAGLHADVHSLRASCATFALRSGAPVEAVRKLLRHATAATTLAHYSKLGIADAAKALEHLPSFDLGGAPKVAEEMLATGTEGPAERQQKRQHSAHDSALAGASPRDHAAEIGEQVAKSLASSKPLNDADLRDSLRLGATQRATEDDVRRRGGIGRRSGLKIRGALSECEEQEGLTAAPSRTTADSTALGSSSDRVQRLASEIRELDPSERAELFALLQRLEAGVE